MKKFTLLLCLFVVSVMMPQVVMAEGEPYTISGDGDSLTLTITTQSAGTLTIEMFSSLTKANIKAIVLNGKFNADDLDKIKSDYGFNQVKVVNMANARFIGAANNNYMIFSTAGDRTTYTSNNSISGNPKSVVGTLFVSYSSNQTKRWVVADASEIPSGWYFNPVSFAENDRNESSNTNYNDGYFIRFPQGTECYHLTELDNEYEWLKQDAKPNQDIQNATQEYSNEAAVLAIENPSVDQWAKVPFTNSNNQTDYTFYQYKQKRSWVKIDDINQISPAPTTKNIEDLAANRNNYLYGNNYNVAVDDYVYFVTEYHYYRMLHSNYSWQEQALANQGESHSLNGIYATNDALIDNAPNEANQYAVVGGSVQMFSNSDWGDITDEFSWSQMKFYYWSGSLETVILPAIVNEDELENGMWNSCTHLTRVELSATTYADLSSKSFNKDNKDYYPIYAPNETEYTKLKTIIAKGLKDQNDLAWANESSGNDPSDTDNITKYVDNTNNDVWKVEVTSAGSFKNKFPRTSGINDNDILWFTSDCVVDSADLIACLTDGNPKYYIDLYDIDREKCPNIEYAIKCAIDTMRKYNRQFKGLILPANPTTIGTTLIMDRAEDATKKATCSEFIAYRNQTVTSIYVYSSTTSNRGVYVNQLTLLKSMMDQHLTIGNNTSIYCVSSNHENKIGNESGGNITNTVSDILGSNKTIIETIKNDMVSGGMIPNVYVASNSSGAFAYAVEHTSIKSTPRIYLMQMEGQVSSVDIDSLNRFASGMKVLDLMGVPKASIATNNTNMLSNMKILADGNNRNDSLQYVILPAHLDTTVVHSYANLPNVIGMVSVGDTALTAHLGQAGQLHETLGMASATAQGIKKVTLRGNINFSDINTNGNDQGLSNGRGTIRSLDLEKALFVDASGNADCSQMRFWDAGFNGDTTVAKLSNIKLPIDARMNTIPEKCLYNLKALKEICIPYNYEYIYDDAFNESNVNHITTTDTLRGAVIDNGPNTFTFSKNLKQLGTTPYKVENGVRIDSKMVGYNAPRPVSSSVFPKESGVKEIYCLATKVPLCYKNVFEYSLTFGYGGQNEEMVYCRNRYYNNGDSTKCFTVLRYPSEEVFNKRGADEKEATYAEMVAKYTDVTKVYTKKDQTGAVDANGHTILWPARTEGNRVYNQAGVGALWDDWMKTYSGFENTEINDGEQGFAENHTGNSGARRMDSGSAPANVSIELTGATQTTQVTETVNGETVTKTIEGVVVTQKDTCTTFTPKGDMQNMFQHNPLAIPTFTNNNNETVRYNRIVVKFAAPVPDGFYIHGYGPADFDHSWNLANKSEFTLNLTDSINKGKTSIDDFTIFNYWGCRDSISIKEAYFAYSESSSGGSTSYPRSDLVDYLGWHQIVLTQASYVEPKETIVEDSVVRDYQDAGWFTFCIPFDMTYSQVVKMLGVPKSEGRVINRLAGTKQTEDVLPDIRQLKQVLRKKGSGSEDNQVTFILTTNLLSKTGNTVTAEYLDFGPDHETAGARTDATTGSDASDPRCIIGGRPYIIHAYKRKDETIKAQNIGKFILTRYADEFNPNTSCVNHVGQDSVDYYEQLFVENENIAKKTLKFAKPYEKHKVQAVSDDQNATALTFGTGNRSEKKYYYTMVGQFWEQDMPLYCLYMSKNKWFRYTDSSKGYKWDPYKCVIMATPEEYIYNTSKDTKPTGDGGFRKSELCNHPEAKAGTTDLLLAERGDFKLGFVGRDDDDFNASASARYIFAFEDDEVMEYDEDGNEMTAIKALDGVTQQPVGTRVYSISGQYMGKSTNGLAKGIYIVGGRKVVVD